MGILSAIFGKSQSQMVKPSILPNSNLKNSKRNYANKHKREGITDNEIGSSDNIEFKFDLQNSLEGNFEQISSSVSQAKVTSNDTGLAFNTERLIVDGTENPFSAVDITKDIAIETLKVISSEFAKRFQVLPFMTDSASKTLHLYYADEDNRIAAADLLKRQYQGQLEFIYLDAALLLPYIDEQYSGINSQVLKEQKVAQLKRTFGEINNHTNEEKATLTFGVENVFDRLSAEERRTANMRLNFLGTLICDAHHQGASDIDMYLDRTPASNGYCKTELLVTGRIDGDIKELYREKIVLEDYNSLTRVLRIACNLDGAQDTQNVTGLLRPRIKYGTKETLIDLRVNFMHASSEQGASISIRIQDKFNFQLNLNRLGLFPFQQKIFQENIISARNGLVAFAAPVNKGKNVSLVSTLLEIKKAYPGKKVVSLENPIEFILQGINQIEIAPDKQYGNYLREVLRHNPDITVFSETRTDIDAKACIEAAIQGQLTLTTIHADNASQVIGRLHDLGINHYKIANALRVVVSQRLVRKNCDKCVPIVDTNIPKISYLDSYITKINWKQKIQFIKSSGKLEDGKTCPNCQGLGYRGRFGVFEVLKLSVAVRELINRQASNQEILKQAINEGFQTIWANGLRRVLMGETTLSELIDKLGYPDPELEGMGNESDLEDDFDGLTN